MDTNLKPTNISATLPDSTSNTGCFGINSRINNNQPSTSSVTTTSVTTTSVATSSSATSSGANSKPYTLNSQVNDNVPPTTSSSNKTLTDRNTTPTDTKKAILTLALEKLNTEDKPKTMEMHMGTMNKIINNF